MGLLVYVEAKRIIKNRMSIVVFVLLLLFSFNNIKQTLENYESFDDLGEEITAWENLSHSKKVVPGKEIRADLYLLKESDDLGSYANETNLDTLVAMNYPGKEAFDLSKKEIDNFYINRLAEIKKMLNTSSTRQYTSSEKAALMRQAKQLSKLSMNYAEGWKNTTNSMGEFSCMLIMGISLLLLPVFGKNTQIKIEELAVSTKYGKKQLENARLITALGMGSLLYFAGIFLYFIMQMACFGMAGGNQWIQGNEKMFFSVYHITYLQQVLWNVFVGWLGMILAILFTVFVSLIVDGIITGVVCIVFYWILLNFIERLHVYKVNHWFANFMPIRMNHFEHYYIDNELYRIAGKSIPSLNWTIAVSVILSAGMLMVVWFVSNRRYRKRG